MPPSSNSEPEPLDVLRERRDGQARLVRYFLGGYLGVLAGRLSSRLFEDAQTLEQLRSAPALDVTVTVLFVASTAAILVEHRVNQRQQARGAEVLSGEPALPPPAQTTLMA